MEHKHKLLATASSQAEGASSQSIIDRFSNLPDKVAHRILSFLNFRQLTRVGSVSRRCRGFYLSTPSLDFYSWSFVNKQKELKLFNSFERFLIHRGDNKIERFCIHCHVCPELSDEIFRLITWIHIAVRCNVEVIDFELRCKRMPETLELPSCIFLCASLRYLLINFETFLKAPSSAGSNNLQYLRLSYVKIDEGFFKWISSSCKCIKELQLDHVGIQNINIESSSLESFGFKSCNEFCHLNISGEKLVDINIEWGFYTPGSRSLNISAPNLKYFKWIGELLNHHDLGKFMCLEKAEIFLKHKKADEADDCDFDDIFEVLCSICRVKILILSEDTIKALFREGSMPAPLFDDISYLSIHTKSLTDDLVPAMVSLLRGMPKLNTLCINSYPSLLFNKPKARRCNRKYWKSQNLAFVCQLKEVTIELSNRYNGLELALYFLEHAKNLKKMVIVYLPRQLYVIERVNKNKKISTATVVFHEKQDEEKDRFDASRYLDPTLY